MVVRISFLLFDFPVVVLLYLLYTVAIFIEGVVVEREHLIVLKGLRRKLNGHRTSVAFEFDADRVAHFDRPAFDFHIIQITMGWNNEYLHSFRIYGEDYGLSYEGGMSFNHNARQVFLDDFELIGHKQINVLDIGTGSGCIAISLAKYLKNAKVDALDISENALEVAQENASLNKVEIGFMQTDILKLEYLEEKYDIIVSNPPYVRMLEKEQMNSNVIENEPELALFVEDKDSLVFYRKISEFAKSNLKKEGCLYFEINQYLGAETKALLANYFYEVELHKDMFGNDRMLKGKLS